MLSSTVKRYIRDLVKTYFGLSSTYDFFSTLYTTLLHNLIKDKLIDLIEKTFWRKGSPYLSCNYINAFFTKTYQAWPCQNVCEVLTFSLDNIFIRFGTKLLDK